MGTQRHTQTHWDAHTGQVSLILVSTRPTPETLSAVVSAAPPPPPNESSSNQCVPDGPVLCAAAEWKGVGWGGGGGLGLGGGGGGMGLGGTHAYDITAKWAMHACCSHTGHHQAWRGLTHWGVGLIVSVAFTPSPHYIFGSKMWKILSTTGFFHLYLVRLLFSGFPSHSSNILFCSHLCLF